jgi:hypothetical protein
MSLGQPSPPNPQNAIGQGIQSAGQTAQDINQPIATENQAGSNYNQYDPYGSLTYSQTGTGPGGVPIYSSSVNLSQAQQGLLNTLQGTQQSAGTQASNLLGGANYGGASPTDVIGNLSSGLTGQNMQAYLASADPFFATQSSQLDTQLRNQGLQPGQPAYDNAMRSLDTNQGYSVYGAAASFEPQAFQQATTEYQLPEQMALQLGQFGAPANPTSQFETGSGLNIQTPNTSQDISSMVSANQNQYTAQQNQYNAMIQGLMSVTGGLLAA